MQGVLDTGIPVFGICLGNQILGRALGLGTYKLRFGHRGRQPAGTGPAHRQGATSPATTTASPWRRPSTGRSTRRTAAPRSATSTSTTAVVEGLRLLDRPAFSVQYHPEAAPGPHDAAGLFDEFCELMSK